MLTRIVCALLCAPLLATGQFSENFNVSDIRELSSWKGTDSAWMISNGVLQSASSRANGTFYFSRPAVAPVAAQWEWWIKLDFNTSSTNYADVFLQADADSLPAASGFFVRIGNTQDEVSLYKKQPGGVVTKLIDGKDGLTAGASTTLMVKVVRTAENEWQLFTKSPGGTFAREGKVVDSTKIPAGYFGMLVRQSTSTFWGRHFFDDIVCTGFQRDITAPDLTRLEVRDAQHIFVLFSESVDTPRVENFSPQPSQIIADPDAPGGYMLSYVSPFPSGLPFNFSLRNIKDESDNYMPARDTSLLYYRAQRRDVLIHEIFPDPTPPVGLPPVEYVELYNRSAFPVQLKGWKLQASAGAVTLPVHTLQPKAYFVLSSSTGLPSLANEQDQLVLYDNDGAVMHAVAYDKSWYGSTFKENGGWSLEMIDVNAACAATFKASIAAAGGTPGAPNSVAGTIAAATPSLVMLAVTDSMQVQAFFNISVDSVEVLVDGLPVRATPEPPLFQSARVVLPTAMRTRQLYALNVVVAQTCANTAPDKAAMLFGLPEPPAPNDVVINEVLFNPPAGAEDFVELYNRSNKVIDCSQLYLANRRAGGNIDNITRIHALGRQLLPGGYLAVTTQRDALCRYYACKAQENLLQVLSMPSFPNDAGSVLVLDAQGNVLNEFAYSEKMHFPLISNRKGISLERLDSTYWHSAAGGATPGYANSQQLPQVNVGSQLSVVPRVFSPDNDGRDDLAFVRYNFTSPGKVANVTVFDAGGRAVRALCRNELLGNTGSLVWDGLSDGKTALRPGMYVVYVETFGADGKVERWKLPVALAGTGR